MSIFNAAINRNQTGLAKKEDLVPISVKITKKVPYYDWTMYYVQFKNDNTGAWKRFNICFPRADMKVNDILPIITENGLDTKNISKKDWPELRKDSGRYQTFFDWRNGQYQAAKEEGLTDKTRYMKYSYTKRSLWGTYHLIYVTMRMYGQTRKFRYVFDYDVDKWMDEDIDTGLSRIIPLSDAICCDVESMISILPHTNLTIEEWNDREFFKELYATARKTIETYNSCC